MAGIRLSADAQHPLSDVRPLTEIVENDTAPRSAQVRVLGVRIGLGARRGGAACGPRQSDDDDSNGIDAPNAILLAWPVRA